LLNYSFENLFLAGVIQHMPSIVDTPKPTVLVIDDEAGPRDALKVILRPFFNVQSAENASAALDILSRHPIDLITLDQKLPDRHGMDLLQEIKHDHVDTEVIIVTGYGSLKSAMDGIRYGAAGYLLKPFNVTELITLINQTLEKKRRLDFIRTFFQPSSGLWGTEQESTHAWQALQSGYAALCVNTQGAAPAAGKEFEWLPLLSDLLEATDRHLLNHSSRVSFYATLIGNRLNLTSEQQKCLTMGAFLHDLGKAGIALHHSSDEQLQTSTNDTDARNEHPDRGAQLIRHAGLSAEISQVILCHHERWDGQGYPHGLQGEGIPFLARIVALAQTFDHLTTELMHSSPMSVDEAIEQISSQAHTYFDPSLTNLFIQVINECKHSLPPMAIAATATERRKS
jgi:putative two-component system response regulator